MKIMRRRRVFPRRGGIMRFRSRRSNVEQLEPRIVLAVLPVPIYTPDAVPEGIDGPPYPDGDPPEEYDLFEQPTIAPAVMPVSATTWTPVGPAPLAAGQAPGQGPCTGRISGVAVDPTDANT